MEGFASNDLLTLKGARMEGFASNYLLTLKRAMTGVCK